MNIPIKIEENDEYYPALKEAPTQSFVDLDNCIKFKSLKELKILANIME